MLSPDELNFQDFGTEPGGRNARVSGVHETADAAGGKTYSFSHVQEMDEDGDMSDSAKLLEQQKTSSRPSFLTFDFYQQFFDVDTNQVITRLLNSMIPRLGSNYIIQHLRPQPDLYGPFWICVTLIFSTAIAGNLSTYITSFSAGQDYHWSYDFRIVTAAATLIFAYVWLVPLLLYGLLWWRKSEAQYSYVEMLATYGYSMTAYVLVSILWLLPWATVQWICLGLGLFFSSMVLAFTFWPAVKNDNKLIAVGMMLAIIGLHGLLAIGFKTFFFKAAQSSGYAIIPVSETVNNALSTKSAGTVLVSSTTRNGSLIT